MLECVVNISEGHDDAVLAALTAACGAQLLDVHRDAHHNRSVFTLVGEEAPRALAAEAVARLDLRRHRGVHPRIGIVDVVPFTPLGGAGLGDALTARTAFARWAGTTLQVPAFLYGPERTLPEVRKGAFTSFPPDFGPGRPHLSAGAMAVGAREALVAYNVWLAGPDVALARAVAATVRGPHVRALGLAVGERAQVSMNLTAPRVVGPAEAFDEVRRLVSEAGGHVAGAELVGLVPAAVLEAVDPARWEELDLGADRTVEGRLEGGWPGRF